MSLPERLPAASNDSLMRWACAEKFKSRLQTTMPVCTTLDGCSRTKCFRLMVSSARFCDRANSKTSSSGTGVGTVQLTRSSPMRVRLLVAIELCLMAFFPNTTIAQGTRPCSAPAAAITKLQACLAYENGLGANEPTSEHFSIIVLGNRVSFRLSNSPSKFAAGLRPVYIFEPLRPIDVITCPADASWVACAAQSSVPVNVGQPCDIDLAIPKWKPTPDSP